MPFEHIGSVSTGTMRSEDLIPCFLDVARALDVHGPALVEIEQRMDAEGYFDSEAAEHDMEALFDILDERAPDYCHFGAHEGDGADYGFWISWDLIEQDRIGNPPTLPSGDEVPHRNGFDVNPDHDNHFLQVSDHGNATLYYWDAVHGRPSAGHWVELWAVV